MNTGVSAFDYPHQLGDPATHPITGLPSRLAALLLLAGNDHARRRALPAGLAGPKSGVFNRGIKDNRSWMPTLWNEGQANSFCQ